VLHPNRTRISTVLILLLIIPTFSFGQSRPDQEYAGPGMTFREQVYSMIDDYQELLALTPANQETIRLLNDARVQMDAYSDEEFEVLAVELGEPIGRLRTLIQDQNFMNPRPAPPQVPLLVPGDDPAEFPNAEYPNVGWDFGLVAYAADPLQPTGNVLGAGIGLCNQAMAPDPGSQFIQLNLTLAAEAIRDTASRVCGAIEDAPLPFSLIALACIVTDVAYLVVRGVYDNNALCSSFMTEAEIRGSYWRVAHIHNDLATAETTLLTRLGTAQSRLTTELNQNQTLLESLDTALFAHDQNFTARADLIDGLLDGHEQILLDFREENLRNHIERRLSESDYKPVTFFLLPDASGGQLDNVHLIVAETLSDAASTGVNIKQAEMFFGRAEEARAGQDFKDAFDYFGKAYRAAVK
jgi:hypothetical protein